MSDNHYEVDETLKSARDLMDAMRGLRGNVDKLGDVRGAMIQEQDNGASGNAVYAKAATRFGFAGADLAAQQANAAAGFAEIDSAWANLAALNQMLSRFLE